ncbi:MAG: hypothetical protein R3335_07210 [Anaerolineales bacterium]|nr:hypothetical protein [Anaerolineales bacterium]
MNFSDHSRKAIFLSSLIIFAAALSGCAGSASTVEPTLAETEAAGPAESGSLLGLNDRFDETQNGARLILTYDEATNSFYGKVENTTDQVLKKVRIEVRLSNGVELGPTVPMDLTPGQSMKIRLHAESDDFNGWSAHPEVGGGGHSYGPGDDEYRQDGDEHDGDSNSGNDGGSG